MGLHRHKHRVPRQVAGFVAFAMAVCLAWGPAASAQASSEPIIESESASHITSEDATLNATINTQGLYTAYEFQIDTVPSYNFPRPACPLELPGYPVCEALITGEPLPAGLKEPQPGSIPAGSSSKSVSVDLASIGATLQPGTTYHFRVIAANTSDGITVYGPDQTFTTPGGPAAGTAPSIDEESVSKLSPTDTTLEARVNPHEASAGVYYQFQLATDPSEYAPEILCPSKLPPTTDGCNGTQSAHALPIGFIAGDTLQPGVDRPASLDLASAGVTLKPRTTYHYRLLVARRVQTEDTIQWEAPTVYGSDQTFTTPPEAPAAPVIDSVSLSHLTMTDATLEAQINTEGQATTYEFLMWYEPCAICENLERFEIHLPSGLLLGSFVDQSVSLDLNSAGVTLRPGAAYGYSVRATNAAGSPEAQWQTFEPPAGEIEPLDPGVSRPPSGGQLAPFDNSGQSAGSATTAIPALQGSSSPGASSKTSAAKPAAKHKRRRSKAVRHRAGATKHKRHKT